MGMVYFNLLIYHLKSTKDTSHMDPMGYGAICFSAIWSLVRVVLRESFPAGMFSEKHGTG